MRTFWEILIGSVIAALIVIIIALAFATLSQVRAHDFYDMWCCHENDCVPLIDGSVTEERDGYHVQPFRSLDHVSVIPYNDRITIKQSPDGHFHGCEFPKNNIRCLYVPGRGF